jgi:uncharacterized protein YeaO (DUF488 family)
MKKGRCDIWMPTLGPSEELLLSGHAGRMSWTEFSKRYRAELFEGGSIDKRNRTIKNHGQKFTLRLLNELAARAPVTLMCYCSEDQPQCHRHILQRLLRRRDLAAT